MPLGLTELIECAKYSVCITSIVRLVFLLRDTPEDNTCKHRDCPLLLLLEAAFATHTTPTHPTQEKPRT